MKTKVIREMESTEFGDFVKSKTVITETCSTCSEKDKRIRELEEKLATWNHAVELRKVVQSLEKQNAELREDLEHIESFICKMGYVSDNLKLVLAKVRITLAKIEKGE